MEKAKKSRIEEGDEPGIIGDVRRGMLPAVECRQTGRIMSVTASKE